MEEIFIFQATVLKFCDLLAAWKLATNTKFQHNISEIMPARTKKHKDMGNMTIIISGSHGHRRHIRHSKGFGISSGR